MQNLRKSLENAFPHTVEKLVVKVYISYYECCNRLAKLSSKISTISEVYLPQKLKLTKIHVLNIL